MKVGENVIHYVWVNSDAALKTNPLLIFLHEGLGSIKHWKDFPNQVCAQTQCEGLVYERYGYGASSALREKRTASYLEEEGLEQLPALLEALQIDRPIILIGHSDGGSISLVHAGTTTHPILGVITEAAHVYLEAIAIEGIEAATQFYESSPVLKKKLARYHGDHTDSTFYGWSDTWRSEAFKTWNIEKYLPQITCPVLVIQGTEDEYGTLDQVHAIANQVSGKAQLLVVEDCKHVPHHQQREKVLAAMVNFIRTLH